MVQTRSDLAVMVGRMRADLTAHPGEWENSTLERYLEALSAAATGIEQAYLNRGETIPTEPTWEMVATLLYMASGYE